MLSKRSVRIQKGVLAARDKRMGVLNELIGAVNSCLTLLIDLKLTELCRSSS